MPSFDNIFKKVKTVAKQTTDQAGRLAKSTKLRTNVMTLNSERGRQLTTIGQRAYALFAETNSIDGKLLLERVRDEIAQIERIDSRIREIESEIADLQASSQDVDVTDVTENRKE